MNVRRGQGSACDGVFGGAGAVSDLDVAVGNGDVYVEDVIELAQVAAGGEGFVEESCLKP